MKQTSDKATARLHRETKTLTAMFSVYCKGHHQAKEAQLCTQCKAIRDYTIKRLHNCPLIERKPTCANCLIHCYNKDMQNKVRIIMRYSGPRILLRHPLLTLYHFLDSRIKPQAMKKQKTPPKQHLKERTDGNIL